MSIYKIELDEFQIDLLVKALAALSGSGRAKERAEEISELSELLESEIT